MVKNLRLMVMSHLACLLFLMVLPTSAYADMALYCPYDLASGGGATVPATGHICTPGSYYAGAYGCATGLQCYCSSNGRARVCATTPPADDGGIETVSICPNWTDSSWIESRRTLNLRDCSGQGDSTGTLYPTPTYLDPWLSCSMNSAGSGIAQSCITAIGGDPTGVCRCPAYQSLDFMAMSLENQALCCTSDVPATTNPPATPTPVTVPNPTCQDAVGGIGRACSSAADCCGTSCAYAGGQLYAPNRSCTGGACMQGPKFTSGYAGTGSAPAGGVVSTVAQKVCVNASDIPTADYMPLPASVSSGSVTKSLVTYDGTVLRCLLDATDPNRSVTGCQCNSGSTATVIPDSKFPTLLSENAPKKNSRLEMLWAGLSDLISRHREGARSSSKVIDQVVKNAQADWGDGACIINSPDPLPDGTCSTTKVSCSTSCLTMMEAPSGAYPNGRCVQTKCVIGSTSTTTSTGTTTGSTTTSTGSTTSGVTPSQIYSDQNPAVWKTTAAQGYRPSAPAAGQMIACVPDCGAGATPNPNDLDKCMCTNPGETLQPDGKTCSATCMIAGAEPISCVCPTGYDHTQDPVKCNPSRDLLPEYKYNSDNFLVCGDGRIPTAYDMSSKKIVSSDVPRVTASFNYEGLNYLHSVNESGFPRYIYQPYPHCACVGHTVPITPADGTDDVASSEFGFDHYEAVAARVGGNPVAGYGPVTIALDGVSDGRLGTIYGGNQSFCGCPNINEEMTPGITGISGPKCVPRLKPANRIFAQTFDPTTDSGSVLNDGNEIKSGGVIVKTINLASQSDPTNATIPYKRGIWKCKTGFSADGSGNCTFNSAANACDTNSPVSGEVGGSTAEIRFANAKNKKLACCLNQYDVTDTAGSSFLKFDCIENAKNKYTDFNNLWTSTDDAADGGQMNAFVLANSGGKEMTGFYTMAGERCNEFSEFTADAIQPGIVNAAVVTGQMKGVDGNIRSDAFQSKGSALGKPSGAAFTFMTTKLGAKAKAPTTSADRRRCPILVRAALLVSCPMNPQSATAPVKTYESTDGTGTVTSRRCSIASSVQVNIRVEQVWEIGGQTLMAPIDTIVDKKDASTVSIDRIIADKYGDKCPPGTTRQGDTCVY